MTTSPAIERRRVFYTGRVQGVGFRYTAVRIAQSLAVTGFVRNLADRRVELVAEGTPGELDRLLAQIAEAMADYVHNVEMHKEPATGEFTSFDFIL